MDKKNENMTIGTYSNRITLWPEAEIVCATPEAERRLELPWVRAHVEREIGHRLPSGQNRRPRGVATVPLDEYDVHSFYIGKSGGGKSRAIRQACSAFMRSGDSLIVFEPKFETFLTMFEVARLAGLPPQSITGISTRLPYVPGFNILRSGLPAAKVATDLADIAIGISGPVGPRMLQLAVHLFVLLAVHRLTLLDGVYMLTDIDNLMAVAARPAPADIGDDDSLALDLAVAYFTSFSSLGKGERAAIVAPVITRLSEIARSMFFTAGLGSEECVDIAGMWKEQRVVIVHLDQGTLGTNGMRLLAGLVSSVLFRSAFRAEGSRRVRLVIDEAATAEAFIGRNITEMLSVSRSLGLSVQVACQHLSQLSDELRSALLSQVAVTLVFGLGHEDARAIASGISAGRPSTLRRLVVGQSTIGGAK